MVEVLIVGLGVGGGIALLSYLPNVLTWVWTLPIGHRHGGE